MGDENETLDDEHDDEQDDDDEDADEDSKSKKSQPKEVTMTQRRLTSLMSKEKDEGRRAGRRALLAELDVDSVDDLKELVKAGISARDRDRSDSEKAKDSATRAERERDEAKKEAATARFESKLDRKLLAADVPAKSVDKVRRLLDLEPDAEDSEIAAAIEDLEEEFPHLFGAPPGDDGEDGDEEEPTKARRSSNRNGRQEERRPPHSDTGRRKTTKTSTRGTRDQARSLLHERHPNLAKKD